MELITGPPPKVDRKSPRTATATSSSQDPLMLKPLHTFCYPSCIMERRTRLNFSYLILYPLQGLPLVRWLSSQRNSLGGFSSTQDTVIALQALSAYAQAAYIPDSDVVVSVVNGNDAHNFTVNSGNAIVLQSYEVLFFK